jgi:hypothetical protein
MNHRLTQSVFIGYRLTILQDLLPSFGLDYLLTVLTFPFAYLANHIRTLANDFPQLFIQLVYLLTK